MDKRIERLIKAIKAEFKDVELYQNMHDGTHIGDSGAVWTDKDMLTKTKGAITITIHMHPTKG